MRRPSAWFRPNITIKLTAVLTVFALAIITAVSVLAYTSGRTSLRAAAFAELESRSIEKQAALDAWIARAKADAAALAASVALSDEVAASLTPGDSGAAPASRARVRDELSVWAASGREFSGWVVIDAATGRVLVATDPKEEGLSRAAQPFFVQGKSGVFAQSAYLDPVTQTTHFTVAAPVRDASGRVIAVLAGHLDVNEMNRIVSRRTGLRQTDDAFLLNTSRLYVTQPRFISGPAVLKARVDTQAANLVLQGKTGQLAAPDYRGVPSLIVYRWLPDQQMGLIVKLAQAEALEPLTHLRDRILLFGLLALLVTSALAYGLARSVTVPVKRLAADAREIGAGNLNHHVEVRSDDEIGQLATAFAQMAADLSRTVVSRDELLREISQRERAQKQTDHLFEVAPDMIAIIGFDGRFQRLNPAWETTLGYSLAELTGRPFMDFVHPEDREATSEETKRLAGGARTQRFENRYLRKDGAARWFSWAVMPALDERVFYCMTRDITEERGAEDVLRESERLLRQAEAVGHLGHWSLDLDDHAMTWSEELRSIYGVGADGLILDDLVQWVHPDDREHFAQAITTIRQTGEANYDHRVVRADGSVRYVTGKGVLVHDAAGRPPAIYGVALDTTDIKQKERELEERNAELARFTYTASHDLKSPLVTIQSFLGYLEADMRLADEERVQKDLLYLRAATTKMSRLLDELLDFSRVGRRVNPPTAASLQEIAGEAAALVAGRIADRGVRVDITEEPVVLWGDRVRLVEVFQNLLDNAVKFMGDQPEPRIEVGAESDGGALVFFVRDNGMGVEPQFQAKLFGLFEKLDPQSEGTGLGLALVERIVKVHGGRIWVHSDGAGRGTTFRFTLSPRTEARPPETRAWEENA